MGKLKTKQHEVGQKMVEVLINCNDGCIQCENAGNSFDVQMYRNGKPFGGFTACYNCIMLSAAQMIGPISISRRLGELGLKKVEVNDDFGAADKCLICGKKSQCCINFFNSVGECLTGFFSCQKCRMAFAAQLAAGANDADKYQVATPKYVCGSEAK